MHPPRIRGFSYLGFHRYLLTFCVLARAWRFCDGAVVRAVLQQFRREAGVHSFAILAYCFMPDHAHLLVEGISAAADLRAFVVSCKQQSGYWFRQTSGERLWEDGFYDHVLRDEEQTLAVIKYILANPVRAGLAKTIGEYPFAGSDVYSIEEVCACLQTWVPPHGVRQG